VSRRRARNKPGSQVPRLIRYSGTPSPTPFAFEVLPCSSRTSATVTLAAATASRSENQLPNGLSPPAVSIALPTPPALLVDEKNNK
jgi:hypothetical protein